MNKLWHAILNLFAIPNRQELWDEIDFLSEERSKYAHENGRLNLRVIEMEKQNDQLTAALEESVDAHELLLDTLAELRTEFTRGAAT